MYKTTLIIFISLIAIGGGFYWWYTTKSVPSNIPAAVTASTPVSTSSRPVPYSMFSCSPQSQIVTVNQQVTVQEDDFEGHYHANWNAPGGNPETGSGYSFKTMYTSPGEKVITATSIDYPGQQETATCRVTVQ